MSLLCPRCQTIQPQENHHCAQCGLALPAPAPPPSPAFRFAEPVLLAEEMPPPVRQAPPEAFLPTVQLSEATLPQMHPPEAKSAEAVVREPETPEEEPVEVPPEPGNRPRDWRLPAFSALVGIIIVGLIIVGLALAGAARIVSEAKRAAGTHAATLAASPSPVPSLKAHKPSALPLTVLLQSAAAGRHVSVGSQVVITAFAMLDSGQNAALALSCKPERGRKTMFSFAEGRLCSANWTPLTPGRYQFTATVLDDQCHSAVARPFWIIADGPTLTARTTPAPTVPAAVAPLPVSPLPVQRLAVQRLAVEPLPIIKVSRSLSEWRASRAVRAAHHTRKPRVLTAQIPLPTASVPPVSAPTSPPPLYHVVAASFRFPANAAILARALRERGLFAVTGHRRMKHGKTAYLVEVGSYPLPDEAQKKMLELQRRGYPAFTQSLR